MDARARIILQSDWRISLSENSSAWITFKKSGKPSINGSIKLKSGGECECSEGFSVDSISGNCITVSYKNEECQLQCQFRAPRAVFDKIHAAKKNVVCVDVTGGGLGCSCDTDGKLRVWTTDIGEVRRELVGHYSDVNVCKFFPSGVVLLTGGADTLIKIWSVETGQCAATLKGHQAGVNDVCIVERGRNVVSVSRDGTARLWDCGRSQCITTLSDEAGAPLNCCSLGAPSVHQVSLGTPQQPPDDREVLTDGKMLLVGTESGSLRGYNLRSREKVLDAVFGSAVNCCAFINDTSVLCGTDDSRLILTDLRNSSTPLIECQESRSAILSLLPRSNSCFISTGDGSCYEVDRELNPQLELTGSDCDPLYHTVSDESHLFTSCRDGIIRKYSLT